MRRLRCRPPMAMTMRQMGPPTMAPPTRSASGAPPAPPAWARSVIMVTLLHRSMSHVTPYHQTVSDLTIDELARQTGMTVRNIRAHQSRGLLPPPEVRGRTGYYGPEHLARIELIREMQGQGFNLEAIRRLVEAAPGSSEEPLRFLRAVAEPYTQEQPEVLTGSDLADRWGTTDVALLDRAIKLGLLRPLGDGSFEDVTPRLTAAGKELERLGVPPGVAMDLATQIR